MDSKEEIRIKQRLAAAGVVGPYEVPALTAVTYKAERGYAASGSTLTAIYLGGTQGEQDYSPEGINWSGSY